MCLYPLKLRNKKYTATEKNGGVIPDPPVIGYSENGIPIYDDRVLYIEVPCGQCMECRDTKAREWQVRLAEELKGTEHAYFLTLTFAPKELKEVCKKTRLKECNAVAEYALRHCLERWRKDYKKSLRHWMITELGHEGTERIHMHGLLFSTEEIEFERIERKGDGWMGTWKYWKYGRIFIGDYVNAKTINYISKYITKIDTDHKGFVGQILASPGIGRAWVDGLQNYNPYQYRPHNTIDYYRTRQGVKLKLPKYYKNKLYTEEEREMIWRDFMDLNQETIAGNTYSRQTLTDDDIKAIRSKAREVNKFLEYGDDTKEWRKREYNITKRMIQQVNREKAIEEMKEKIAKKMQENLVV